MKTEESLNEKNRYTVLGIDKTASGESREYDFVFS